MQEMLPVRRIVVAVALVLAIFLGGAAGYWLLGHGRYSLSDCLYMTAITVSTVGFREVIPVGDDPVLRAYTIVLIFAGGGSMLYLLSIVTAFLVEGDLNEFFRRRRMDKTIERLDGHYLVCGVGRSGEHAIRQMTAGGFPLVVIERSEQTLREFMDYAGLGFAFVIGDATEENVLLRAGVDRARGIVAALPKDQDNIFLVLTARALNPTLRIVSKVNEQSSRKKLLQVGADAVVSPSEMGGLKMFNEMVRPGVSGFLESLVNGTGENLLMDEVAIGAGSSLHGKKLSESAIRSRFNLLVVGVRGKDGGFVYNPAPDHVLESGTSLIVLGPREAITELRQLPTG